jgi:hypothetical protein
MRFPFSFLCVAVALSHAVRDKKPDAKDAPAVLYAVPLAVAPGHNCKLTLRGLRLDGVTGVKSADPNVKVKLAGKPKASKGPNNYPAEKVGDGELEVELELPKDFAAVHVELVAVGPKGESRPFRLTVDPAPVVAEKEPNDSFAAAQDLTLPAVVVGTIGREKDVDVFRFAGKAGERVRVEVVAARLGSPVDGFVTVYDAGRRIVGSCDDADGSPDPALTVTLPRDGTYYVALIDAHDGGGPMFPYRLRVAKEK